MSLLDVVVIGFEGRHGGGAKTDTVPSKLLTQYGHRKLPDKAAELFQRNGGNCICYTAARDG
jgi:hypothetical protein